MATPLTRGSLPASPATGVLPARTGRVNGFIRAKAVGGFRGRKAAIVYNTMHSMDMTPWEPSPVVFVEDGKNRQNLLSKADDVLEVSSETFTGKANSSSYPLGFFKWPLWLLGPALLLITGMAPTLWLPLDSIYVGPEIASLLALLGLDCIFHLGATLFLLMADLCSRPRFMDDACVKIPPLSYKVWNMLASLSGLMIPLATLLGSLKEVLHPQLPVISFAVLLGPYLLLLSVQMLTEMLTWHWQSPVWLVTPVIYEAYRVLQLMRGLKLAAVLTAPPWMLQIIRGMICWWILVLGVQLMNVVWFAGFVARPHPRAETAARAG